MLNVDASLSGQANSPEVNQLIQDLRTIMGDLSSVSGLQGNPDTLVTCRLNQTGANGPAPIWCGWVEKQPSPGSPQLGNLLGKDHISPIYRRCFHAEGTVHKIPPGGPGNEKDSGSFNHDGSLTYNWRAFMCVKDNNGNKIGTLTVGFKQNPPKENQVTNRLTHWAQGGGGFAAKVLQNFNPSKV